MSLPEHRDVLGALIKFVRVNPAIPPVNQFNPRRVDPVWRF